jgi:hypothetical protein
MSHTGAIKREVTRLESNANSIENEAVHLVEEIEMKRQERRGMSFCDEPAPYYYVYVFGPNVSQETQMRKLAADYETWFNKANELVRIYLPNRIADFESYYTCISKQTGLFYDLRLHGDYEKPENKSAAIRAIKNKFDCQRNIVNSIPDVVEVRGIDLLAAISNDLINSELDCAEHIFKKDKTHDYCLRIAGILAGIALERHLKTRCELELGSLPERPTLSPLIIALYTAKKITLNQKKYLEAIATTRNDCAHATTSVTRTMVGEAISNVKKHLEGNL